METLRTEVIEDGAKRDRRGRRILPPEQIEALVSRPSARSRNNPAVAPAIFSPRPRTAKIFSPHARLPKRTGIIASRSNNPSGRRPLRGAPLWRNVAPRDWRKGREGKGCLHCGAMTEVQTAATSPAGCVLALGQGFRGHPQGLQVGGMITRESTRESTERTIPNS